jgi:hypothetical protein
LKKRKEFHLPSNGSFLVANKCTLSFVRLDLYRIDEKAASEYNVEGGSVLHLVLALRGGH